MKYFVILKQLGEGCDYTIGCGTATKEIEAKNEFDLYNQLSEIYDMEEIETIKYVPAETVKDLNIEKLNNEYEEYLKLKAKFDC